MERGKKTGFILRQFKRKSKQVVHKDFFTEFFYLNRERRVIEFLTQDGTLALERFFHQFIPSDFRSFVSLKVFNDVEEEIKTWYFDEENAVLVIAVNWGTKRQEISVELCSESFAVSVVDEEGRMFRDVDYALCNDFLISFVTLQARTLAESFTKISKNVSISQKKSSSMKK